MRPTASTRTFLTCLVLPFLLSLSCLAQNYPGSGTQFTNGQNGTPNLPLATSCTIDKTHFANEVSATGGYSDMEEYQTGSVPLPPPRPAPTSSLYVGTEVRTGAGRPVYVLPALTYGLDRYGVEFGGESFFESGTGQDPGRDSVGLSVKVELTDLTRGLVRRLNAVKDIQAKDFRQPLTAQGLMALSGGTSDLLTDYVRKTRHPVVSFIVGDRFVNDGGSLPQAGLTASQLFPLSYGGPGVTLLTVAQGFSDRTRGDLRRDAGRFGAALIFRDRTPALLDEKNNKVPLYKLGTQKLHLGPTWNVKEGLEYTSPILGLKETYAGFVTYRDPSSYGEITLTAGKDGLRKDYLDISVGRSFVF